jgi:hypothetical protein
MCYPFLLPAQVTAILLGGLVILAATFAPLVRIRRWRVALAAGLIAIVLFVPTCVGVGFALDSVRYGDFHFDRADEVWDDHVRLPPQAVDITYHKFASGHYARFTVDEWDLREWLRTFPPPSGDGAPSGPTSASDFEFAFSNVAWTAPSDVAAGRGRRYLGPRASNGAGFDVWYSPETREAFVSAGYW